MLAVYLLIWSLSSGCCETAVSPDGRTTSSGSCASGERIVQLALLLSSGSHEFYGLCCILGGGDAWWSGLHLLAVNMSLS